MSPTHTLRPRVIPQRLTLNPEQFTVMSAPARRTWVLAHTSREVLAMHALGVSRDDALAKVHRDLTEVLSLPAEEAPEYMAHAARCYDLSAKLFPPGTPILTPRTNL